MLVIRKDGIAGDCSDQELVSLRSRFNRDQAVFLPGLLGEHLLRHVQGWIKEGQRWIRYEDVPGAEAAGLYWIIDNPRVNTLLSHFFMDEEFLRLVGLITGEAGLGGFNGRVCRMEPGGFDRLGWHFDGHLDGTYDSSRPVVLSVALGEPFEGGSFSCETSASGPWCGNAPTRRPAMPFFSATPRI